MHQIAYNVVLEKMMILGYVIKGFVTYKCIIWIS